MREDDFLSERAVVDAILRNELYIFVQQVFRTLKGNTFVPGWYLEVVTDWLMLAANGDISRLIITMPPRHLKSICASVALPAWILGRDPSARITCVSYGDDLAKKHARDCLKVMESVWYKRTFTNTRISKKRFAISDFETTEGGGRLATSVGGALTGRGGRYIIVDDPIKPDDARSKAIRTRTNEWFDQTVYSRFDDPEEGVMIIVMQRVHLDDLVGHVMEKEHWDTISFPAIAEEDEDYTLMRDVDVGRRCGEALHPERMSLEKLAQTKRDVGDFAFQSQYQQQPVPEAGNIVKRKWFQTYDHVPPPAKYSDQIVQSWDTAVSVNDTADWSVCQTWAIRGNDYYLIDVYRERVDFPMLTNKVIELQKLYGADVVLIEDEGAAKPLIQSLRSQRLLSPIGIKVEGAKEDRMIAQTPVIEAGRVFIPKSAIWLSDFFAEVVAFPAGRHDDQIDAMSQVLNWAERPRATVRILHVKA